MIIAADHPARGARAVGGDRLAMADRGVFGTVVCPLERPGVTGVLATATSLKASACSACSTARPCFGSMNRGGLPGRRFEVDDRFTGYDAAAINHRSTRKMLTRIALEDPATASVLENTARAIDELTTAA